MRMLKSSTSESILAIGCSLPDNSNQDVVTRGASGLVSFFIHIHTKVYTVLAHGSHLVYPRCVPEHSVQAYLSHKLLSWCALHLSYMKAECFPRD